jgi:guanylate kinase
LPPKLDVKQPRLIIISAPSGAGKTTLCELLRAGFNDVVQSISFTTRPQRPHEEDGKHYFFVSLEDFESKKNKGDFVEWAKVHGNFYGTSKKTVEDLLQRGKHVLFAIDVEGALNLKKVYPDRALLIFVHPPSINILEKRLMKRQGDSSDAIKQRLINAKKEIAQSQLFDYQIVNDQLDHAYSELKKIILQECACAA